MVPTTSELGAARDFVSRHLTADPSALIPFSLSLGGRRIDGSWAGWSRKSPAPNVVTLTDPARCLEVRAEVEVFSDLPAVEWVVKLAHRGPKDTPIIEQVQALDIGLPCPAACTLRYNLGSLCSLDDFAPVERRFSKGAKLRLTPGGGRSSSEVLPFFNVDRGGEGIAIAIGWSGEWAMEFARGQDGELTLRAGMDRTHLVLHPGEEIRTPRIMLMFWQGEHTRANHLVRRHILEHHRPKVNGNPLELGSFVGTWGATPAEIHVGNVARLQEKGIENNRKARTSRPWRCVPLCRYRSRGTA